MDKLLEEQNEGSLEGENALGAHIFQSFPYSHVESTSIWFLWVWGLTPLFCFNNGSIGICCKTNAFRVHTQGHFLLLVRAVPEIIDLWVSFEI